MSALNQRVRQEGSSISQLLKAANADWYIGKSDIQGKGIFAGKQYLENEIIDVAMYAGGENEFGAKIWNLTTLSRYCNHQENSNSKIDKKGNIFNLVTTKPIKEDEEIFADYRQVTRAVGPNSRMLWAGEPIPSTDLEDYLEKKSEEVRWRHSCCDKLLGDCPGCPGNMRLYREDEST